MSRPVKQISDFFDRVSKTKYFSLIYSLIINFLIFIAFLLVNRTYFEIADDVIFSQYITDGYYNIKFTNYFLCIFIGLIQDLIYPYNAYVIVHLFLALCAYIAITKVLTEKFNYFAAAIMTVFLNCFFAVNNYMTISFTRLPGLLTVAGFLCIIHYASRKKWIFGTIVGMLFVLIGSAYRFSVFEMSLIIAVAFVFGKSVADFLSDKDKNKKFLDFLKVLFEPKRFISAVLIVAVCFSVHLVSNHINTSTEELSYYSEYTSLRAAVWDYEIPDYEECKAEYDAIGIDSNDIEMLRAGYFDDQGGLDLEQLQNIKQIQDNYNSETKSVITILKTMFVSEISEIIHLREECIIMIAFGISLILFLLLQNKKKLFVPVMLLAADFVCYFYLWNIGRTVYRVLFTIWFASVCYLLYSFDYNELKDKAAALFAKNKKRNTVLSAVIFAVISVCGLGSSIYRNPYCAYFPEYEPANQINEYINSNTDSKFEMARETCFSCGMPNVIDNVYHTKKSDFSVNYKTVNCTYYRSPYYNYQLEQFGTDNFYENLLNDNVYFVTSSDNPHNDMMKKYLEKYYNDGREINMELVDEVDNYYIYNYSKIE